jgi:tetratricopeptide (TPR) repeat protein
MKTNASSAPGQGNDVRAVEPKDEIKSTAGEVAQKPLLEAQECLDRGVVFALYGERQEAVRFYRRALLLDPANPLGHYVLGLLLMDLGDREHALEEWRFTIESTRGGSQQDWARRQAGKLLDEYGPGGCHAASGC